MKILVNASITRMGGGIQKSVEFIRASIADGAGHEYFYVLSDPVARNLERVVEVGGSRSIVASPSPSHPVLGRRTRLTILKAENEFQPDVVYTVLGPAYVRFRSPHLMGFATPWITHPNRHAWQTLQNPLHRARFWAWCRYVEFWTRFADRWVLETEVAAKGLSRALSLPRGRFHVVPNVPGSIYASPSPAGGDPIPGTERMEPEDVIVLSFAHWYPHKNLEIVPSVAAEVRKMDPARRYRFVLTFDRSLRAWSRIQQRARRLGVEKSVVNLGPILVGDGPRLYRSVDVLFLPTVLETFTATYPEAMACRRPIVTTDLPFARDLCGDAALYAAPNDAIEAATQIVAVAGDRGLRDELVGKGIARLRASKTGQATFEMMLGVLGRTARDRGA